MSSLKLRQSQATYSFIPSMCTKQTWLHASANDRLVKNQMHNYELAPNSQFQQALRKHRLCSVSPGVGNQVLLRPTWMGRVGVHVGNTLAVVPQHFSTCHSHNYSWWMEQQLRRKRAACGVFFTPCSVARIICLTVVGSKWITSGFIAQVTNKIRNFKEDDLCLLMVCGELLDGCWTAPCED